MIGIEFLNSTLCKDYRKLKNKKDFTLKQINRIPDKYKELRIKTGLDDGITEIYLKMIKDDKLENKEAINILYTIFPEIEELLNTCIRKKKKVKLKIKK